jgi:ADP-ribosyl-[dinitrogen reductase] hydrolase
MDPTYHIKSVLFGVVTGDALGVPVEFYNRDKILKKPVMDMIGYGTYNLPAGTWSDDSSLTFCLADSMTRGFDLNDIAKNFVRWYSESFWTPWGNVFDIGMATREAIYRLMQGVQPDLAGGMGVSSNGNGSLMRIAPLLFYIHEKPLSERYELTKQVSSITHAHIRSVIACFYYLEFARELLAGKDKFEAYETVRTSVGEYLESISINPDEIRLFHRLLYNRIDTFPEAEISSGGYVLHTLEASIWCLLTTDNYSDAVLKAVNLGEDTDTTAAVTGGLAGLIYGFDDIPTAWTDQLAKREDILSLAERLGHFLSDKS